MLHRTRPPSHGIVPLFALFCLTVHLAACAGGPPIVAAARAGRADEVARLISAGSDPDAQGGNRNTALYQAARQGHIDVVRLLIDAGADVDAVNTFGSTPLHVASRYGHVDVIRALIEAGADVDARNLSGLEESDLARRSAIEAGGLRASTPLAKAARAGQREAVEVLVELGAALPARDAMEQASLRGHDEIAAFLADAATRRPRPAQASASPSPSPGSATTRYDVSARYGRRLAAVIGIGRYERMSGLEGARGDAEETAELLRTLGFDAVYELYDEDATRAAILDLLGQRLRREATEDDLVFVFYAGHGATETIASGEKRGYLVPVDGSSADPYVSGVSMEAIRDLSNRLAARHVYYAIDACYSGSLIQRSRASGGHPGGDSRRAVQVVTAGLEGQQAIERDGRGLFTTYLLEALRGGADANRDGRVTASEIGLFVSDQVGAQSRGRQTPAYGHLGGAGEIAIPLR